LPQAPRTWREELDRDALDGPEIVVRTDGTATPRRGLLAVVDQHLARAKPHAAGTTDRLLAADRSCPY
jgi:hypothetical protein